MSASASASTLVLLLALSRLGAAAPLPQDGTTTMLPAVCMESADTSLCVDLCTTSDPDENALYLYWGDSCSTGVMKSFRSAQPWYSLGCISPPAQLDPAAPRRITPAYCLAACAAESSSFALITPSPRGPVCQCADAESISVMDMYAFGTQQTCNPGDARVYQAFGEDGELDADLLFATGSVHDEEKEVELVETAQPEDAETMEEEQEQEQEQEEEVLVVQPVPAQGIFVVDDILPAFKSLWRFVTRSRFPHTAIIETNQTNQTNHTNQTNSTLTADGAQSAETNSTLTVTGDHSQSISNSTAAVSEYSYLNSTDNVNLGLDSVSANDTALTADTAVPVFADYTVYEDPDQNDTIADVSDAEGETDGDAETDGDTETDGDADTENDAYLWSSRDVPTGDADRARVAEIQDAIATLESEVYGASDPNHVKQLILVLQQHLADVQAEMNGTTTTDHRRDFELQEEEEEQPQELEQEQEQEVDKRAVFVPAEALGWAEYEGQSEKHAAALGHAHSHAHSHSHSHSHAHGHHHGHTHHSLYDEYAEADDFDMTTLTDAELASLAAEIARLQAWRGEGLESFDERDFDETELESEAEFETDADTDETYLALSKRGAIDEADLEERANWLSARAADRRLSHRSLVDPESDVSTDFEDCPDTNTTDTIITDALTNSTDLNLTDSSPSLEQLQTQSALLTQQLQGVTSQIAILNGTQAVAGVGADRIQSLEDEKTQLEAQLQAVQAQIEVLQHQVDLKQAITEGVQVMQEQDQSAATQQKRAKGFDGMFARWFGSNIE